MPLNLRTRAARIYLLAAVTLIPAPYVMPLSDLFPTGFDRFDRVVVWPTVVLISVPLAVVAVLFAVFHELHGLAAPGAGKVAGVWSAGVLVGVLPLVTWTSGSAGYYLTVGVVSVGEGAAAVALIWLAHDVWRRRVRGRWWFLAGLLQVAWLQATWAFSNARQFWVSEAASLEEFVEGLLSFAFYCALAAAVLAMAIVVAWWTPRRGIVSRRRISIVVVTGLLSVGMTTAAQRLDDARPGACVEEGAALVGEVPVQVDRGTPLPRKTRDVVPQYPELPQGTRVDVAGGWSGEFLLSSQGEVIEVWTIQGVHLSPAFPAFNAAIVDAIRQWRFEPLRVDGRPVAACVRIGINITWR